MNLLASLFSALDEAASDRARVAALAAYFRMAPEVERVPVMAWLSGRRPRRVATLAEVRAWASEISGLPGWLVAEAQAQTGDLAETLALILPPAPEGANFPGLSEVLDELDGLRGQGVEARREGIAGIWAVLPTVERYVFIRLVTGGLRLAATKGQMIAALAEALGQDAAVLAYRLAEDWAPGTPFASLVTAKEADVRPYPFARAALLEGALDAVGPAARWGAEWAWDGLHCQLVTRSDGFALWAKGAELVTGRFPGLVPFATALPADCVLEGMVVAWNSAADRPLPRAALPASAGAKSNAKVTARFIAFDLLEAAGVDLRACALAQRRTRLEALLASLPFGLPIALSPLLDFADWAALESHHALARQRGMAGLLLKRLDSPHGALAPSGSAWKWPLVPLSVLAVMIYAQTRGTEPEVTLALRDGDALVPVVRTGLGLPRAECVEILAWVKAHTANRFGPVRQVSPELVFELAFDGVQASPRHKCGLVLQAPRILRWCRDAPLAGISLLGGLRDLPGAGGGPATRPPRDI